MKERSRIKGILKSAELLLRRGFLLALKLSRGFKKQNRDDVFAELKHILLGSPTILFLRQDRLGDAIITTPLLVALHSKYPKAKILMLLGANNEAIKTLLPIEVETFVYRKNVSKDWRMLRELRARTIDILIDLTDNASVTSSLLIERIHPKIAVGIEKENAVVYDILVPRLDPELVHISRRVAELLRPLGIDPDAIPLQPVLQFERSMKVQGRIGINVSAGSQSRYAPASVYAAIAKTIANKPRVTEVRVLYGPSDHQYAEEIVQLAASAKVMIQPGAMSFSEFGSYLSTCEILITPDTSIVHLGAAASIPMVVLYAPIPAGLQYWTPTGVPFEMLVQRPSLAALEPDPVLALFDNLRSTLHSI